VDDTAGVADRVLRNVTVDGLEANAVGGAVVTVFLNWLTFGSGVSDRYSRISLVIASGYGVTATGVGFWRARGSLPAAVGWLESGREPTASERMAALTLPVRLSVQFFESWAGAAVVFAVLNATAFHNPATRAIQVAATVALGGLTTCLTFFLLAERRMRSAVCGTLVNHGR